MKTKRQGKSGGPLIPLKVCVKCGKPTVITHSESRDLWCYSCGNHTKGTK